MHIYIYICHHVIATYWDVTLKRCIYTKIYKFQDFNQVQYRKRKKRIKIIVIT